MAHSLLSRWKSIPAAASLLRPRCFRSKAALEAIAVASQRRAPNVVLYNYPSFPGAFSALFAHLFHSHLNLPCLILPFSSVEPFRVEDFYVEGFENFYFLDFLGPKGFAAELSRRSQCKIVGFDHRKLALPKVHSGEGNVENIEFHVDLKKSSSSAIYEYFSTKLADTGSPNQGEAVSLVKSQDRDRVDMILKYISDIDLQQWSLPDIKAFNIGLGEWRSKFNCITNPHIFEQLLEISSEDLISRGNSYISMRVAAASKMLDKVFKLRLGRGLYGECLGVRADEDSTFIDEMGKQLSEKSAAAGLRPIGAVIYMQRKNLKMCLRSTDTLTDTSEVAKAYGGGGSPCSSSFIIRMDEYTLWRSS